MEFVGVGHLALVLHIVERIMNSEEFTELIIKYINNSITASELDAFNTYLTNKLYDDLFKSYIEANYLIDFRMKEFNTQEAKQELIELIRKEQLVEKKKKIIFYKYATAATFLLLVSLPFFLKNNDSKVNNTSTVTSNQTIEPGTDKAVLTLENGEQIPLEKGQKFNTRNADSDGENIVYQQKSGTSSMNEVTYNYLTIPRGGQFFVQLSDGTQVWLNSESQLKYPVVFLDGETRQVELVYGEAYFDVSPSTEHKGSKFKVINQVQEVEVLGTEFNIRAYKDESDIYTTLIEGKVVVNILNKDEVLIPSQQLRLNLTNNNTIVSTVNVYRETSWKKGVFSFKNKPLKDIMKVLSRWYEIDVIFKNKALENTTFNGTLKKKLSIIDIMETISSVNNIDYEINNKTVLLK